VREIVVILMVTLASLAGGCATPRTIAVPAAPVPPAAPEAIDVTLFLIGDAGAPSSPEPVLEALRREVQRARSPVIIYLGDNIYPRGMPASEAPDRADAERRVNAQLAVPRSTGARAIFIPGNHDWGQGLEGWDNIKRQEEFINASRDARSVLLPGGGCPGPAVVDLGTTVRLVILDTQWWLHEGPRPLHPTSACPADSPGEVTDALRRVITESHGRVVILAGHHPLRTGGPHGGHFGFRHHVFPLRELKSWLWLPLPIIGSAYPIARRNGITNQDLSSTAYGRMVHMLDSTLADAPALVYASGHEHSQQVLGGTAARYLLVTGGGYYGHLSQLTTMDRSYFAQLASGFMRLEVLHDRRARLAVTVVDAATRATDAFALWLQ
jgi:hypothetical protein